MAQSVFISYSHRDGRHKDRLLKHLKLMERQGLIAPWDDRQIVPTEEWDATIRAHLNQADLILLLITADFLASDYCWDKEMTRAMERRDAGQAKVLPIFVDHCDWKDAPFGKIQGVPKDARPITAYENPNEAWKEVAQAIRSAVSLKPVRPADGLGLLHGVPAPLEKFVPRPEYAGPLQDKLLAGKGKAVAVTGAGKRKTAVQGMGGIGKTVLAAGVVREEEVRRAFPDGVFWLTFGQQPNPKARQEQLAQWLGDARASFEDTQQGKARLEDLLRDSACLIVLDDIWDPHHVEPFDVSSDGRPYRLLITTRFRNVVTSIGAEEQRLDVLEDDQALSLLAKWAGTSTEKLPNEAPQVVKECGGLPLALAMIGAMIQRRPERWGNALLRLRQADIDRIRQDFPHYPYPDLLRAIEVSIDGLDEIKDRYLDFAVFPEDTPIPQAVLHTLWAGDGLDKDAVDDILDTLEDRSMLRRDEKGRITLHDLQFDYVRHRAGDKLPAFHRRLLAAYRRCCAEGWHDGPDDGYFYQHLAYHLRESAKSGDLTELLFDYRWLRKKLEVTDANGLMADYDLAVDDSQARLVQGAIRLSSHMLAEDASHLPSQLCGRLLSYKGRRLASLLSGLMAQEERAWLRPLAGTLTPPGGPLVRTLRGHESCVNTVAVTPDGRYIVSGSSDKTLRVWDLASGRPVRTLAGHGDSVGAVAVTPDGRYIVSGSRDKTLKVWDLAAGKDLQTLRGHEDQVRALAVTPDGHYAVSASDDKTLRVWDLASGKGLHTLGGHEDWVYAVAVTCDGRHAVSASPYVKVWEIASGRLVSALGRDGPVARSVALTPDGRYAVSGGYKTAKVWELAGGRVMHTLTGHEDEVNAVAVTPDGRSAVSGSEDGTLKVWELSSGRLLRTLKGHEDAVNAVAVTPDSRYAVSGSWDSTLKVWDLLADRTMFGLRAHEGSVHEVAVTPDGRYAVSGSSDKTLKVWDLASGKVVHTLRGHRGEVGAVAVTPDGHCAVSGSKDTTLKVWDLASGKVVHTLRGHRSWVRMVAVTPDGRNVVSASQDGPLKVWDLASGRPAHTLRGHMGAVFAVAVTPDGRHAVSGSYDRTLKVWDLTSGQVVHTLRGHEGSVAVTGDGRYAVSGSADQTLKVWDLKTGRVVASFVADGWIPACAAAPDGVTIVAGDAFGQVHFLRLENVKQGRRRSR
jgi:WD40 repeat protein